MRVCIRPLVMALGTLSAASGPAIAEISLSGWETVVNNAVQDPRSGKLFNSYNQPSVNAKGLVVFRGRSKGGSGGGEPAHGVYTRDMATKKPLKVVFDRATPVPQPNNLGTLFVEPPSFPRIDIHSDTLASRGSHAPVWNYVMGTDGVTNEPIETRAGTTGIYANPFGGLITGASLLGAVPGFEFFSVPGVSPPTKFDVFPGAPAVDGSMLVFKGNFTLPSGSKTGVYYRNLEHKPIKPTGSRALSSAGGMKPVVLIADNVSTLIPDATPPTLFGSTAPPSAAGGQAVFAGFDNEDNPTLGGIYRASLAELDKPLEPLVKIGGLVPGENVATFNRLGEGISFDGRFVAFWGAWGDQTTQLKLKCRADGNPDLVAFCKDTEVSVPVNQGIFVHDTSTGVTQAIAKSPADFSDFVYWNFSGHVPGVGESDDASEPARWRSATFVAVSGMVDGLDGAKARTAFKARKGSIVGGSYVSPVDGIYLRANLDTSSLLTVVETGMEGTKIDPQSVYVDEETGTSVNLPVTEMGIERDGFRGNILTINVSMGTEDAGWAGIYLTTVGD